MYPCPPWSVCLSGFLFIALSLWIKPILHAGFRAGASAVDIAPQSWPVRVNAMFTERNADHVVDALWAKSLSLGQGDETIILCVVDTCMMPRDLIDQAKQQVQVMTGVSTDRTGWYPPRILIPHLLRWGVWVVGWILLMPDSCPLCWPNR